MNYDRIILELMSRVQSLEEELGTIKSKFIRIDEDEEEDCETFTESEQDEVTRNMARDKAIQIIQDKFPDFVVTKATRKEGSGVKIHKPSSKKPQFIKFYHSKEHRTGDHSHSWHVVRLDDVIGTVIDFCMFSYVDSLGKWNFFIYEQEEIGMYYDTHRPNSGNNILHLYLVVNGNSASEQRESEVDVTDHLNNWHVLK